MGILLQGEMICRHSSADFLAKCGLSASSVRSALAGLCENEIIYRDERGYFVYERLFGEWLKSD